MNFNLPALVRIPLFALVLSSLVLGSIALPARADDSSMPINAPPLITLVEVPYPFWFSPFTGGAQDSFKFGDEFTISVEVTSASPLTSLTADLSELGIPEPVEVALFQERDPTHRLYRTVDTHTVATHGNGSAVVHITATDEFGRSSFASKQALVDNVPPLFRFDGYSFVNTTTTPEVEDPVLVSGVIDPEASKAFVLDTHYTLYGADGLAFPAIGFFRGQGIGVALSSLTPGTFTNQVVNFWFDTDSAFRLADASFITITSTVLDGAGNRTTITGPKVRVPKTGNAETPLEGASNVLFLPGIEGSRLYEPANNCNPAHAGCAERKLWDPSSDADLAELMLDRSGKSIHSVYTKEGDTIDSAGPFKFYSSFINDLNARKNAGTMADWKAIAYDWRLSLADIVQNGAQQGTHIDYAEATETPYIEQTLRALAATSKSGKVTIIAHSAGGLVTKALLQKLGDAETARLVDTVVFVGVPQSGTPQGLAGLLHGYGTALPLDWCVNWVVVGAFCTQNASRAQARALAENTPLAYDLLPSAAYFDQVQDPLHPVTSFVADHLFAKERNAYGSSLDSERELIAFAAGVDGGREKPTFADLAAPNLLNADLLENADAAHAAIDAWTPPTSVQVYQIAGWGADTLSGIEYYEARTASAHDGFVARYRPQFVEDGDAVVTVPSALMQPLAQNVKQYWLNLRGALDLQPVLSGITHSNLFEAGGVRQLVQNILTGTSFDLPVGITDAAPKSTHPRKRLLFTLHGSVHAVLRDGLGNQSSVHTDGSAAQGIPEVQAGTFGDTSYFLTPAGPLYQLVLDATEASSVDLDVQRLVDDTIMDTATFQDIRIDAQTQHTVDVSADGIAVPEPDQTPSDEAPAAAPAASTTTMDTPSTHSTKPVVVSRTKGIATSRSVLTPPKPIKAPVVSKPVPPKPKAKPLTRKQKKTITILLDQLKARLQDLLLSLPH